MNQSSGLRFEIFRRTTSRKCPTPPLITPQMYGEYLKGLAEGKPMLSRTFQKNDLFLVTIST